MKIGMRKPNIKKSIKARTTGKYKRAIKKAVVPGYGKKGSGWIKDPQKAAYNKIYNKTAFGVNDVLSAATTSSDSNVREEPLDSSENSKNSKALGCLSAALIFILYVFFINYAWIPCIGIFVYTLYKKPDKKIKKLVLTGIAIFISLLYFNSGEPPLSSIEVSLPQESFDINDTAELSITLDPEDVSLDSLTICDNDIVDFDFSSEHATISFKEEGTVTIFFTANELVESNQITLTVVDNERIQCEQEEADRLAAEEEAKRLAEEEAARIAAEEEAKRLEEEKAAQEQQEEMVWIPSSGSKYHSYSGCSNMKNPTQVTLSRAKALGYSACQRCH